MALADGTTSVRIVKYASDGVTVISEVTVDYTWMMSNLLVYGDGTTHYYHQGPVLIDDPDEETEQMLRWNPEENDNVLTKDMGAVKGSNIKDLCDLVGGAAPGDTIKISDPIGFSKTFAYKNVYNYSSREGPMIITWYTDFNTSDSEPGVYPDTGYTDGMRLVWFADDDVNPWGVNAFGNYDWYLAADEEYWYYYSEGAEKYPTTTGLSVKYISEIAIYSNDPVPPPNADFMAMIKTGQIINGGFETGDLTGWTNSAGVSIYKKLLPTSYVCSGNYSVKLAAPVNSPVWISQVIDVTDLQMISFYRDMFGGNGKYLQVYLDSTLIADYSETTRVTGKQSIDISSYGFSGNHTLTFKSTSSISGTFTLYLDDIEGYSFGTSGEAPLCIQFQDLSTNSPTSWAWDFQNDGTTDSTERNPLFIYTSNGSYTVKLTATNADGSDSEIKVGYINVGEVTPPEFISFTVTDYNGDGVKFGSLDPGQSDQPADGQPAQGAVTITVGTETNVYVDVKVMGTDFAASGNTISIGNVRYNDENDSGGATALSTSYVTWYTVETPLTSNHVTPVYYWITIPPGQPAGDYASTFSYKAEKASP